MEVDPQASHSVTPMDCNELPTLSADAVTRAQFWSALHRVPSDLIEPIFCWFDSYTDFDTHQVRAAILSLHAQQPGYLYGRPHQADVQARLLHIMQSLPVRESSGSYQPSPTASSPPPAHTPRRIAARPIIPPGYEVEAAQMVAAAALTGIAVRRSTRSRTQPSAWWAVQPATAPAGPQEGSSAPRRRPEEK
jgi:hypothetical protein